MSLIFSYKSQNKYAKKCNLFTNKLSHSLRSSSLPRVYGFQTREDLITFVASLNIKEFCKDFDKIGLTDRK